MNKDDGQLVFNALPDGDFTFQLKYELGDTTGYSNSVQFRIDKPIWRKWWFISGMLLAFLILVSFYYRHRLKRQRQRLEAINEVNTSKITAIQSQMNPHFIFNALNSIQALVLKGDTDNSYGYINKFSHLMRRTLSNSEKDGIPLDEEIDLLTNYLELEKLRFREEFTYRIDCEVDDDVYIPPMLLQPFVENSIIHGLLPKEGHKELHITFEQDGSAIRCTIVDNGIGRMRAKEMAKRRNDDHNSFATRSIDNRLKLLKKKFGNTLGYRFFDLTDEAGSVIGTKLTVTLPIVESFGKQNMQIIK